jgi:hypothetical protein
MSRQIMREAIGSKNRLNALLKPIIGILYDKNAPGYGTVSILVKTLLPE